MTQSENQLQGAQMISVNDAARTATELGPTTEVLATNDAAAAQPSAGALVSQLGNVLWDRWSDFWFSDTSGAIVALYRSTLGALNLYWLLTLLQDLDWFFGDRSMTAPVTPDRYVGPFWGLFKWLNAEVWVGPLCCLGLLAIAGLITGRFVRASAIVMAIISISLFRENAIIWNAGDGLLRVLNVLFALSAFVMPKEALNTKLFGHNDEGSGPRSWARVPKFTLRLTQLQLTVIYIAAIIEKVPGEPWRNGTAAGMALKLESMERFWAPDFMTENLQIVNLITWGTLGLEIALPFLLWTKRTRNFAIVAGMLMHFAFDYGLFIGIFSLVMYVAYVSFFPEDHTERALTWIANRTNEMFDRNSDTTSIESVESSIGSVESEVESAPLVSETLAIPS